jgi:hypothetical protein
VLYLSYKPLGVHRGAWQRGVAARGVAADGFVVFAESGPTALKADQRHSFIERGRCLFDVHVKLRQNRECLVGPSSLLGSLRAIPSLIGGKASIYRRAEPSVTMSFPFDDLTFFSARADEAAYLAGQTDDPEAKVGLRQVAEIYATLARRIEEQQVPGHRPPRIHLVKG